jgi:hypothetical protein
MDATLTVNTGVVADLGSITTHTANALALGGVGQAAGTWGSTASAATNQNDTYFTAASTGILTTVAAGPTTYYSRQTGNWNATTTWSTVTYGDATNNGTFPVAGDIVNIGGGDFTITVNVASACGSLSYESGAGNSPTVSINSGITLDVSGAITIPRAGFGDDNILAVGAGTLNGGSLAFTNGGGAGGFAQRHSLTISTGTATISGDITQSGSTGSATITFTGAGLLQVGGAFLDSSNGTLDESTGTVEYNGTSAQTIGDFTYYNLTLSESGVKTVAGAIDVDGDLTLNSGTSFTAGTNTHTVAGNWTNNGATFTNTGSTIELDGTAQTIGGSSATTFNNLTLAGSGAKTFGLSTTMDATISINTGVVADLGSITTHTANALALGGIGQAAGTWGSTASAAANQNDTYFTAASTGILTTVAAGPTTYYSRQTGNWNATTTWSTVTYADATNNGTFPVAGDNVNIGGGDFTITVNVASACGALSFESGAGNFPTVSINSGITLDVSGAITIPRAGLFDDNILAVGAGTLNGGSLAFTDGGGAGGFGQRHFLTISTGTATISGDITQSGSTGSATITFTGAGLLQVGGAFLDSSNGTLDESTGTIEYNGTSAQTIGDFTYYNLTLNNTSGTIPQLTLTGSATVSNSATFTDGVISNSGTLTFTDATATSTTDSYVDGQVVFVAGTNTSFTYPIGDGTVWARMGVGSLTSGSQFTAEYFFDDPQVAYGTAIDGTDFPNPAANVSVLEYWVLSYGGGGASSAIVTLYWEDGTRSEITDMSDLTITKWDGTDWGTDGGITTSTTGLPAAGTVYTNAAYTSFSPFTFASSTGSNPLPVDLVIFEAVSIPEGVYISWETASEPNNDHFILEHSLDAEEFARIYSVEGNTNSTSYNNYNYTHRFPSSGLNYYRLKQVDLDGKSTYSKIVSVDVAAEQVPFAMNVYPNPARDNEFSIDANLKNANQNVILEIRNIQGQIVLREEYNPETTFLTRQIKLLKKSGFYLITIQQGNYRDRVKVILE